MQLLAARPIVQFCQPVRMNMVLHLTDESRNLHRMLETAAMISVKGLERILLSHGSLSRHH